MGCGFLKIIFVGSKLPVEFVCKYPQLAVVATPAASLVLAALRLPRITHIHVKDGKHQGWLGVLECLGAV